MRRILHIALCALLVIAMLAMPAMAADGFGAVTAAAGKPGDTVIVTVSLSGLDKADSVGLKFTLPAQLTLVKADCDWLVEGKIEDISGNAAALAMDQATKLEGDVLKLAFQIKDGTEKMDCQIPMTLVVKNGDQKLCEEKLTAVVSVLCVHEMQATEAKAATCTAEGTNAYYTCSKCGKVYKDEAGKTETTVAAEKLAKLAHTYQETWTTDAENHWHKCANCDAVTDKASHSFKWVTDKAATEEAAGVKHEECACGYKRNENTPIDKLAHTHAMTKTEAKAATCTAEGTNAYYTCTKCGKVYKDEAGKTETTVEAEKLAKLAHAYQETWTTDAENHWHKCANCTAVADKAAHSFKWVTDKAATEEAAGVKHEECACGYKRNENTPIDKLTHTHAMTKTEAKAATCTAEGTNAYYTCSKCGKVYKDEAGKTETTVAAEKLAKLAHAYQETWTTDAENHWHKCANCDAVADKAAHSFKWVTDKAATEEAAGVKHEECACGYKRNENTPIDKLTHTHAMTKTEAKAATCTAEGTNAYYTCSKCGKVYKDEAGKTETTVEAEKLAKVAHSGGKATCTTQAICEMCGKGYGEMASHAYAETWTTDADNHWHKCANCDAVSGKAAHEFEWVIDQEATPEADGKKHEECTICGFKRNENTIIEKPVHTHTLTKVPSKAAACEEDGNIAYWVCSDCDKLFLDKNGTQETTLDQVTVEATGHSYDEGQVTKEPTVTEPGIRTFTCENCGATKTEEIPVLDKPLEPEKPEGAERIAGANRCETAFAVANKLKQVLGLEKFDAVILADGNNYADALAGSYLAAVKQAPILLYRKGFEEANRSYIAENLSENGTVYILGGTAAVPAAMEETLKGMHVVRLAGDNRYLTNLAILEEAGIKGDRILVATGLDFADCLAASATGMPILMVNSRLNSLTAEQKAFLEENSGKQITIIGGEAAVSAKLKEELEGYSYVNRLSGDRREETALKVANGFYPEASFVVVAYSRNFPDALCGGPLAYAMNSPLLLVNKNTESYASEFVKNHSIASGYVLGGTAAVSDASVQTVFGK